MDSNLRISQSLSEIADLLSLQKANPFRIRAYRDASRRLRELGEPVKAIYDRSGI